MIVDDAKGGRVGNNPNEVSQASLHPSSDPIYSDLADIMFAEYATRQPGRDIAAHFLSFDLASAPDLRSVEADSVDAIFSIGYPTADTSYDTSFDEDWRLLGFDVVSRWWKLYFKPAAPTVWNAPGLVPLNPVNSEDPIPDDLDGMSGAPVFLFTASRTGSPRSALPASLPGVARTAASTSSKPSISGKPCLFTLMRRGPQHETL